MARMAQKAWRRVTLVLRTLKTAPVMVFGKAAGMPAQQPADGEME